MIVIKEISAFRFRMYVLETALAEIQNEIIEELIHQHNEWNNRPLSKYEKFFALFGNRREVTVANKDNIKSLVCSYWNEGDWIWRNKINFGFPYHMTTFKKIR